MVLTQPFLSPPPREQPLSSFHTTMVLTQLVYDTFYLSVYLFPYHYGSYATRRAANNSRSFLLVSIPLWFLRNKNGKIKYMRFSERFPYHYGSYATV